MRGLGSFWCFIGLLHTVWDFFLGILAVWCDWDNQCWGVSVSFSFSGFFGSLWGCLGDGGSFLFVLACVLLVRLTLVLVLFEFLVF